MTSIVLYLRVSTEEQVSNLSLDTQEAECRALCAKRGWTIAEVFREEGASAKTLERPQMQRLLAYVGRSKGRIKHVVFLRVDRLSRNRDDFYLLRHALRRHGVGLVSAREEIGDDSISAMIVETFSVLQANVDNLIRASRSRQGMQEAVRRGRWVWTAPVGYRHAERHDGRAVGLELDPVAAPLVAQAFERVAAGASVDSAYRAAVAAGLRGARGGPIGRQTFHSMLSRPIYCGRLEVASWEIASESAAPAIVSENTWMRARQAVATRVRPRVATASLEDFPLRGVARCSCGRKLAAFHARGKTGRRWPYYRCQRCRVQVPARELEQAFSTLLNRLALPEPLIRYIDRRISEAIQRQSAETVRLIGAAQKRLGAAERRLEQLLQMRLDGEIQADEYKRTRAALLSDRDAARLDLQDLSAPTAAATPGPASAWVRSLLADPAGVWASTRGDARAELTERLFPSGIEWANGEFSNPSECLLQLPAEALPTSSAEVVHPTGSGSNPPTALLAWRKRLDVAELAVLALAA